MTTPDEPTLKSFSEAQEDLDKVMASNYVLIIDLAKCFFKTPTPSSEDVRKMEDAVRKFYWLRNRMPEFNRKDLLDLKHGLRKPLKEGDFLKIQDVEISTDVVIAKIDEAIQYYSTPEQVAAIAKETARSIPGMRRAFATLLGGQDAVRRFQDINLISHEEETETDILVTRGMLIEKKVTDLLINDELIDRRIREYLSTARRMEKIHSANIEAGRVSHEDQIPVDEFISDYILLESAVWEWLTKQHCTLRQRTPKP